VFRLTKSSATHNQDSKPLGASTRDAYAEALVALGMEHDDLVVLDADLGKSTRTLIFRERFPERFFDIGIAEQNMIGIAAGLATCGLVPFASTLGVFATRRVCDQVSVSVAYAGLNVKIVGTHTGLEMGQDGATHQALDDISIMRAIPNMTIVVPSDAAQTLAAVKAVYEHKGPVYLRLGRGPVPAIYRGEDAICFKIGKAITLRTGCDLTIMATGVMVARSLAAAKDLAARGVRAGVVDFHTLKPLDITAVRVAAEKTGAIVTAEDHSIIGGLGSAVAEALAETTPVPLRRVGVRDTFAESGSSEDLSRKYGLSIAAIVEASLDVLGRKEEMAIAGDQRQTKETGIRG